MRSRRFVCAFVALVVAVGGVGGTMFLPSGCAARCSEGDFIEPLPVEEGPVQYGDNRAYAWAIMAMIQTRLQFPTLAPPTVGRICGVVGSCLHEAALLNREECDSGFFSSFGSFFTRRGDDEQAMRDTLDGAGFWALRRLFGESETFERVYDQYAAFSGRDIREYVPFMEAYASQLGVLEYDPCADIYNPYAAVAAGAAACERVLEQVTADGFSAIGELPDGVDQSEFFVSTNLPQSLAGITDCESELMDPNRWQPLCIPNGPDGFGTQDCTAQEFLYPWAGRFTPYALQNGDETSGEVLAPEPPRFGTEEFRQQWEQVLEIYGSLDDTRKIIAEYWADGPDTTTPAGHAFKIAADAALREGLSQSETARLLLIVGNAVYDAGIASWRTKVSYDLTRPLQMIQCGAQGEIRPTWRGPYQGVGMMDISQWRPYQAADFVTPPFAAYTSGHSTFSAAASEAMRLFFNSDVYRGPSCDIVREGESLFEPRSDDIPGVSDQPNSGFNTPGYVPADDVVLCWDTFTDASDQSGISRLYGGIHIKADDDAGQTLGRSIARAVFERAQEQDTVVYG